MTLQTRSDLKRMRAEKTRERAELKKKINILGEQRDEIFKLWIYKKSFDEDFIRKEGVRIYEAIKNLQAQHDAI